MSKSPNSNILFPALGGAAMVLGVSYGVATTNYGNDRIEALEQSFAAEREVASEKSRVAGELEAAIGDLQAEKDAKLAEANAQLAALQQRLSASGSGEGGATVAAVSAAPAINSGASFGIGRAAHPDEIAAWDVDILPDGRGLPEGSGDVWTGEEVFGEHCASCHGDFAEGRGAWPVLAGGFDTLGDMDPVKTVGSYWPYLSTVWDYVHRSMPFGAAGTLTDDEVYAITAYILYSNDLVDDDFELSRDTFGDVAMYNTEGFVVDDRPAVEYTLWQGEPCMENCKDAPAEITRRSTDVGVTPADDGSMVDSPMEQQLATLGGTEWGAERLAGSVFMGPGGVMRDEPIEAAPTQEASAQATATDAATGPDPALVAKGEVVFKKCSACHQVGEGAKNRSGPVLNGVVGSVAGSVDGFKYSNAFKDANAEGLVWDAETLAGFLSDPKGYIKGTKMSFRGLKSDDDLAAIAAYLESFSQ